MRYPPKLPYFFLVPVDADSNNVRILINGDQLSGMQLIDPRLRERPMSGR
jgi:hypothetical protein